MVIPDPGPRAGPTQATALADKVGGNSLESPKDSDVAPFELIYIYVYIYIYSIYYIYTVSRKFLRFSHIRIY